MHRAVPPIAKKSFYNHEYNRPDWGQEWPQHVHNVQYRYSRRALEAAHSPRFWEDEEEKEDTKKINQSQSTSRKPEAVAENPIEAPVTNDLDYDVADVTKPLNEIHISNGNIQEPYICTLQGHPSSLSSPASSKEPAKKVKRMCRTAENESKLIGGGGPGRHMQYSPRTKTAPMSTVRLKVCEIPPPKKSSKPPFLPYGSGDKPAHLTHNVLAKKEVHESAMRAKKCRARSKSRFSTLPNRTCATSRTRRPNTARAINSHTTNESPWISEYQKNFSNLTPRLTPR